MVLDDPVLKEIAEKHKVSVAQVIIHVANDEGGISPKSTSIRCKIVTM